MDIKSYRDLLVWQMAMDLAALCYALTRSFPKDELFGIEKCEEIGKMLRSLIRAIQDKK